MKWETGSLRSIKLINSPNWFKKKKTQLANISNKSSDITTDSTMKSNKVILETTIANPFGNSDEADKCLERYK
jgi:hypothetical protein